jgi:hypothetical protein
MNYYISVNNVVNDNFLKFAATASKRLKKITSYVDHMEGTSKASPNIFIENRLTFPTNEITELEVWEEFIGRQNDPVSFKFVREAVR